MNQLTAMKCPNCGAALGQPAGGEYTCAYCNHRSRPPNRLAGPEQAAALAEALARFEQQRRARVSGARAELLDRRREAFLGKRNENGWVMLGIGGLFLLFGVGLAVITVVAIVAGADGRGPAAFGAFWLGLGGFLFYIGVRYRAAGVREKKLRASGLAGRATVVSYLPSALVLDGNPQVHFVLQVELPGRAPYDVRQSDYVPRMEVVTRGRDFPVFVNPRNGQDVLVDWWQS
ncbi:MAG: hypothetical protein JWM74_1572 [Myxococcaceae bacterium]|jgi:hypothetical protein|nr:hypothetical protein [Myxococcaceae bacterium]